MTIRGDSCLVVHNVKLDMAAYVLSIVDTITNTDVHIAAHFILLQFKWIYQKMFWLYTFSGILLDCFDSIASPPFLQSQEIICKNKIQSFPLFTLRPLNVPQLSGNLICSLDDLGGNFFNT